MHLGLRWLFLVVMIVALPALGADDKKEEKKDSTQEKKDDAKKKDSKKKDDKKATDSDDEPKKEEKKPVASLKAPLKGKLKYNLVQRAKIGKLDAAPKYGIVLQE